MSANAHLGRKEAAAAALEKFRKVMKERQDHAPNLLTTQDYMVFRNTADIERLLVGLAKAGVPDLPPLAKAGMSPDDRLTGDEIKSLLFGHEVRGKQVLHKFLPMQRTISPDGVLHETIGGETLAGTAWVQGNFVCRSFPGKLTCCGAVFRNPFGSRGRSDEYKAVESWDQYEFSVVR